MKTHQRERLAEMYVKALDEGRLDTINEILGLAQRDSELSATIAEISESYAEEAGCELDAAEAERGRARFLKALGRSSSEKGGLERQEASGEGSAGNRTLLQLWVEEAGVKPSYAAEQLDGTSSFFDDVNSYPSRVPDSVKDCIISMNEARFGISPMATEQALMNGNPQARMAASRDEAYTSSDGPTFEEMLERSSMTAEQIRYWRDVAQKNTDLCEN